VNHYKTQPPWEFLLSASRNSLQSYELSGLSHAANFREEIGALLDLWVEENSAAMLARWLMEQRERPQQSREDAPAAETLLKNGHSASDNFFVDRSVAPPANRAPRELNAICRCAIRNLPPPNPRPPSPGGVFRIVPDHTCQSFAPASSPNASHNHARRLPSTILTAIKSMVLTADLRLGCFIFIKGRS
jgi:hypothetical protein